MRVRTVLTAAVGIGIGYVLGTRAGRARFEELKGQAQSFVKDPEVRQKVADLAGQVKENLPKAQAVVQDAVRAATEKVHAAAGDHRGAPGVSGS